MQEFITLQQAAAIAGYSNTATLRAAAAAGRLQSVKPGPHLYMTTRPWLDAYLATLRPGNYKRGLPKGQDAGGEVGE